MYGNLSFSAPCMQNLEDFLKKIEAEKGVTGYRQIHADLVAKSEQTAQVILALCIGFLCF